MSYSVFTTAEIIEACPEITRAELLDGIHSGALRADKVGRTYYIHADSIQNWNPAVYFGGGFALMNADAEHRMKRNGLI